METKSENRNKKGAEEDCAKHIKESVMVSQKTNSMQEDEMNESKMINFYPESHGFNVSVATICKNIVAATLFNHIIFWLKNNKAKDVHQYDGRTWMYESIPDIAIHFPYLSEQQVKDGIGTLIKFNFLIKGNYSKNKFDRTSWYAVANEEWLGIKKMFSKRSIDPIDTGQTTRSIEPIDTIAPYIYTDTNTDIKTDIEEGTRARTKNSKKELEEEKTAYRENVLLTEDQYKKLLDQYGNEKLEKMLDILDCKKASKGYKYKSDYHTLTPSNWVHSEWSKQAVGLCSKPTTVSKPEFEEKNKKVSEFAERKLGHLFNGHVFFSAGSTSATLCHLHKDIKKEYIYSNMSPEEFKEILLRDLNTTFPGAKEILMGSNKPSQPVVNGLIGSLAQQMRMTI